MASRRGTRAPSLGQRLHLVDDEQERRLHGSGCSPQPLQMGDRQSSGIDLVGVDPGPTVEEESLEGTGTLGRRWA